MKKVLSIIEILLCCFMVAFVEAAPAAEVENTQPLSLISTELYAEGWVDTQSAKVTVYVNAAVTADGVTAVRNNINNQLQQIAKADWRITQFQRQRDNSGLERIMIQAEARVPEADTNAITDTVKKLSQPGQQYEIGDIDFTASRSDVENAKDKVRKKLYQMANDELARLNELNQDYPYQLYQIDFIQAEAPQPLMMQSKMAVSKEAANNGSSGVTVSGMIQMTAKVVFARELVKEGE